MNTDVTPAPVTTDDNATEVKFVITPKQKLIAKIVGATTVAAGIFALAYRLGSDDMLDDVVDVSLADDADDTDD